MRIRPLDIKEKTFSIGYKGFEVAEVSAFLDIVREEMEELMRENESLRIKLQGYKELEVTWNFIKQCVKNQKKDNQDKSL